MFNLLASLVLVAAPDLTTTAEKTAFLRTGRYDEAVRLCHALASAHPGRARCFEFGRSPEGRPMVALAASADGTLSPRLAHSRQREVIVLQGAMHAGECDGKDAGFMVLRDLLASPAHAGPLAKVTVVFIPVLNVDGHERFGANQRPNQRGPAEAGWRTTAQNFNLNRDYVKADVPEMQALLRLLNEWDPIVYADMHVTDGAKFQHDVAVVVEPRLGYAEALRQAGRGLSDELCVRLEAAGHLPIDFYPMFRTDDDPSTGFAPLPAPPRFSNGYWAARNRLGILLETHSWRSYGERVRATTAFLGALLDLAARDGSAWRKAAEAADLAGSASAAREVPVAWAPGETSHTIDFLGYAYTHEASRALGRPVVRYDESRPEIWRVPFVSESRATAAAVLPVGGWIVPAAHAGWIEAKLRLHGIRFERMPEARPRLPVQAFRATNVELSHDSLEGRQTARVVGRWANERRDVPAGSLFIPGHQASSRIAAYLLDPSSPDSLVAWGFFNIFLERKEYIEDYALEPFAEEILDVNPVVRAEFEKNLADPAFANSPAARLEFFHRLHPSYDEAYRMYPIFRTDARP